MLLFLPKRKAAAIIFEEMQRGAGFHYVLGMICYANKIGAITNEEETALIEYLQERGSR